MHHGQPLSAGRGTKNNIMKERENNQPAIMHLPPPWCSSICRNSMNEVCIEQCAINHDCSGFEPKKDLKLEDMPRFPLDASFGMTKEERFTAVTVYLAKVVDHLQGVEDEHTIDPFIRRQDLHSTGSRHLPENLQVKDLLSGVQEANSSPEDRSELADSGVGPNEVAGTSD